MTNVNNIDALVIGLGPAGACAAAELARAGHRVVALDRKAEAGHPIQCAEFVPAVIGSEVAELGRSVVQPISSMLTFVEGDEPDEMQNFPGQMIDRRAFDAALVDAAVEAGAECRFGVKVDSIAADGSVQAEGEVYVPRLIVGADGPRSVVGASIGQVNEGLVETRQIRVELKQPHQATDIFLSANIAGGYGWLFPRGAYANLGLGVRPEDRPLLKPLLESLHERLIEEGRVGTKALGHTGGPIPVGGMLTPIGTHGSTGVLLAGDAAGLTNPVTGAGINSAAVSGRLAGEYGDAILTGDTDAASEYHEELQFLFGAALERAKMRREQVLNTYHTGGPSTRDLRDSWIAYPQYWAA